jgi:hypothetical protein
MSLEAVLQAPAQPPVPPSPAAPPVPAEKAEVCRSPKRSFPARLVVPGLVLGAVAAAASLLFNVVGAVVTGEPPLQLVRVYLTFPLGETALNEAFFAPGNGLYFAGGCCVYLLTGMLLGVAFYFVLNCCLPGRSFACRFAAVTAMSLAVWVVGFYGILWWLQPLLFGGNWIVQMIPWWVAAPTHLVFGWTILLLPMALVPVPPRAKVIGVA